MAVYSISKPLVLNEKPINPSRANYIAPIHQEKKTDVNIKTNQKTNVTQQKPQRLLMSHNTVPGPRFRNPTNETQRIHQEKILKKPKLTTPVTPEFVRRERRRKELKLQQQQIQNPNNVIPIKSKNQSSKIKPSNLQ